MFLGVLVTKNLYLMTALMFISGMICHIRMVIGYVYCMEFIPEKRQTLVGTLLLIIDGLAFLICVIYFQCISKNWKGIIGFGMVGEAACLLFLIMFLPESPKFLIMQRRFNEA